MKITWTRGLLIGVVALLIIYDIIAVLLWGLPATISYVTLEASHSYPILPFGIGIVCGHLFWPNTL